jgi:hypothetical protein
MKFYHYAFLALKLAIMIQFLLVIADKQKIDSREYIITEILFKTGMGVFLQVFVFNSYMKDVSFEDKVVISFAGGILLYDAWVNDFQRLFKAYNMANPFPRLY